MFTNFFNNKNRAEFIVVSDKDKLQILAEIDERGIIQYARLINLKNKIETNCKNIGKNDGNIDPVTTNTLIERLDAITNEFLYYYKALLQYKELIRHNPLKEVDSEIRDIEENIDGEDISDKYKSALNKRLFILKKRKDKFYKNIENIEILKTQILTIEDIFKLMYEQSISIKNPEQIISQVQYLIEDMKIAEETISEINKL